MIIRQYGYPTKDAVFATKKLFAAVLVGVLSGGCRLCRFGGKEMKGEVYV